MKLSVSEAISYLRQSKHWRSFHLSKCSGCGAPSWGEPCFTCGFHPLFSWTTKEYLAYKQRIHNYTCEEWVQKEGDMLELVFQDAKKTVAWQSVENPWLMGYYQYPSKDSLNFVASVKVWLEAAKKHTWPTREEMWDYVYQEKTS